MSYLMLITYSFDSNYVAIPCSTESDSRAVLEKYLKEEILTVINESEYEPIVRRYDDVNIVELIYESDETLIDNATDIATYRIIELEHGDKNPKFTYLEPMMRNIEACFTQYEEEEWEESDALSDFLEKGYTLEDLRYDTHRYEWAKRVAEEYGLV